MRSIAHLSSDYEYTTLASPEMVRAVRQGGAGEELISERNRYKLIAAMCSWRKRMPLGTMIRCALKPFVLLLLFALCGLTLTGCGDLDTIKREALKKVRTTVGKTSRPFTPREGMTIRSCSLYQTANPNSEVVRKLPAETPVHLIDKIGEWYRVRTRDGREGYLEQKVVGGEDIIRQTHELRRSIEGMPVQAEGVTKTKANFRLEPGRQHPIVEVLPPDKKFEMYERIVTPRPGQGQADRNPNRQRMEGQPPSAGEGTTASELFEDSTKKDVWYKVRIEDGRVGYVYTHNLTFTPPDDIARMVPFMRVLAWRTITTTDDPDQGARNNYLVACAPIGKDPGCDFTRIYFMNWTAKLKRRVISWQLRVNGVLPITNYRSEGKPGFTVRQLHPSKRNRLVLTNFVFSGGTVQKVNEEEVFNSAQAH